jgi:RND family efflux transporter MFP subunit
MKFSLHVLAFNLALAFIAISGCGGGSENPDAQIESDPINLNAGTKPVEVMIVTKKNVRKTYVSSAVLQPEHHVEIVAEVSGKIEKIFKDLGDIVSGNMILAQIDDDIPLSNYNQAKSQVLSAENNLKIARLNLKSDEELFNNGDISKLEYENSILTVKTAEANHLSALANLSLLEKAYNDTRIKTPIDGQIARKYIDIGQMVNPNTRLYRVVDISSLKLEIGIPQEYISEVSKGTKVHLTISALSNEIYSGQVQYISPQADEMTGSFTVEIHVQNTANKRIKAGMTARAELLFQGNQNQPLIPDYTIIGKNDSSFVFLISGNQALRTPVITGVKYGNQVSIQNGVSIGDTIVTVGTKNLGFNTPVWIESIQE